MLSRDSGMQAQVLPRLLLKRASHLLQGRLGGVGADREQPGLTGSELLLPSLWNGVSS